MTNDAVCSQKTVSSRGARPGVLEEPEPQMLGAVLAYRTAGAVGGRVVAGGNAWYEWIHVHVSFGALLFPLWLSVCTVNASAARFAPSSFTWKSEHHFHEWSAVPVLPEMSFSALDGSQREFTLGRSVTLIWCMHAWYGSTHTQGSTRLHNFFW